MKIAIIGAGAIGCVVAAYLKKAGVDVTLFGKDEQVRAINTNGLKVSGIRGEETISLKAKIVLDEEYDLVIFATKTQDLELAYTTNAEFLENADVLTTQNGVQADNILSCHFDKSKMYSSIVMFGATYVKPGEVIFNFEGDWILGNPFSSLRPRTHEIAAMLSKAFKIILVDNITGMKYLKLFVNFNNCIPAMIGRSMQETFSDLELCRLSILLLKEGVDIVKRANIEMVSLPQFPIERINGLVSMPVDQAAGIIKQTLTNLSKEPLYGSILQSIKRGRTSEIDFINGEVVFLAKQMQQHAPLNEKVIDLVHKIERTGKYLEPDVVKKEFNLN